MMNLNELFFEAVKCNSLPLVKYFVAMGADIRSENDTAFNGSSYFGYLDLVKYFVEMGADVRSNDDIAIKWAATNGHLEIVKYLVESGANVNAAFVFVEASSNRHDVVVDYLKSEIAKLENKAKVL